MFRSLGSETVHLSFSVFALFNLFFWRANMFEAFPHQMGLVRKQLPKLQASRQGWHQPMVTAQQCGLDQHLARGKQKLHSTGGVCCHSGHIIDDPLIIGYHRLS